MLSVGKNSYTKTHPLQAHWAKKAGHPEKIYLHAEIQALVKLEDWSDVYLMRVFRYDNQGKPAIAKPCRVCQSFIDAIGIKHVEYTT